MMFCDRLLHTLPRKCLRTFDIHLYHINSRLVLEQRIQRYSLNDKSFVVVFSQFINKPVAKSPREAHQSLRITNSKWINCDVIKSVTMQTHEDQLNIPWIAFYGNHLA